ncbi:MAG: choice-of-anchor D domain-containing protein [Actinobacteria bacterium]|nr:MAG: choice-of-anchor D domain-containing protein [Actinomycetota bacterium]
MRRAFRLLVVGTLVFVPAVVAVASANMSASPDPLNFPAQCTHSATTTKPLAVTNNGPDAATNVTVSVSPSAMASVFQLGGQTGTSELPAGGSMNVQVGYSPQHAGKNSATAVVTFTEPASGQAFANAPQPRPTPSQTSTPTPTPTPTTGTFEIPLSGGAIDRWIDVNPPGVNFGSIHTGKPGPNRTITIFDDGDSPLTITGMFLGGRQPADFSVGTLSSSVVSDGHPATVTLGFHPKAAGARAAKLIINSNSCSGSFSVQLGGIAVEQDITASPKSLDFGNVRIGTSPAHHVAIVNQGGAPLTVKAIQLLSDIPTTTDAASFTVAGVPKKLPTILKPGQSIDLKITFSAADLAPKKANIKVASNDPDTPVLTVPVTASAVPSPTPTVTESAVAAPPPSKPSGSGFHLHLGPYLPTALVALMVVAFFWLLIFTRRHRGIPE